MTKHAAWKEGAYEVWILPLEPRTSVPCCLLIHPEELRNFHIFTVRISRSLLEKNTKHWEGWKLGRHKKASSTLQTIIFFSQWDRTPQIVHTSSEPLSPIRNSRTSRKGQTDSYPHRLLIFYYQWSSFVLLLPHRTRVFHYHVAFQKFSGQLENATCTKVCRKWSHQGRQINGTTLQVPF